MSVRRAMRRSAAGAVDAAMLGAAAAHLRELRVQRFASPVRPDGGVVWGQTASRRVVGEALLLELELPEGIGIFRFERLEQPADALADGQVERSVLMPRQRLLV